MPSTPNNTANVSTGKGVQGGYMFVAPAGTALPTDNSTALAETYLNVGFLGEDGLSFADSSDVTAFFDMNGDTVDSSNGSIEKSFTTTLIEIKKDSLALIYGKDNVTDADGVVTVHDKGPNGATYVVVFELLLKNGRKLRMIGPQVKLGELGDMTFNYSELVGREITMSVLKDADTGDYWTWYLDSTETTKSE